VYQRVPKPLAEIVIDEDLATVATVDAAAEVSDKKGAPLISALVREFAVDEVALVAALRRHTRTPLLDPNAVSVDPEALQLLPHEVCRRLRVVPLSVADYDTGPRLLRVAMADPTDQVSLAELEHHSGCRVEPSLMTLSAVEEMVETAFRRFVTQVMRRDRPEVAAGSPAGQPPAPPPPTTQPHHRLSEEAELGLRHRALLSLLITKHLVTEDEYEEEVRQLMRREDEPRD
jgi:hypothetical protein